MALNTQNWSSEVHKELFETVDFTRFSKMYNDMQSYSLFTLPSAGSITASTDDYVRPLTPGQRVDTLVEIPLVGLLVDPFYVKLDEQWEFAYDKRASITTGMADSLADEAKQRVYHSWLNTSDMDESIKTTGAATATLPTGATGTRLRITYDNILDATLKLDEQNIPQSGRVIVIPPSMVKEIKQLDEFNSSDQISTELLSKGVIGYIDGLQVIKASTNKVLANAVASGDTATVADYGTTGTTFSYFASVYHPDFVCKVYGETQVRVNENDAIYTSDVISATQRVGGGLVRNDKKGFVAIVQEIGA